MGRLLIDSDAFILLAGCGLLEQAGAALRCPTERMVRLDALPHMLRRSKRFRDAYEPDVIRRTLAACDRVRPLGSPGNPDILNRFARVEGVDSGEALLIATLAEAPEDLLLTGDRRSIVAMARDAGLSDIRTAIAGRVVCMETVWVRLVGVVGVEGLIAACRPAIPSNGTLRLILGQANATEGLRVLEGFRSHERELAEQVDAGFLLMDSPDEHEQEGGGAEPPP